MGTNGFSDSQPSVTMVFDGCQPLVQRCDGNDTSFQSRYRAARAAKKIDLLTHVTRKDKDNDKGTRSSKKNVVMYTGLHRPRKTQTKTNAQQCR